MNTHFVRIVVTAIAAAALTVPLSAQQGRAITVSPAQRRAMADDNSPRPQAFSVSLVLGEMQASGGSDNVPAAARKALTDVKDFLPYKAYRLLDSQWTLCCGRSAIVTRLRGPEDQDYALELNPSNAGSGKWYVHFSLWEPRGIDTLVSGGGGRGAEASPEAQRVQLEIQLQLARAQLERARTTLAENHPDAAASKARVDELERSLNEMRRPESMRRTLTASGTRRAIIDTSFTMDVGETVVVGTSRLKGDKALIALLTAVAPAKSAK